MWTSFFEQLFGAIDFAAIIAALLSLLGGV